MKFDDSGIKKKWVGGGLPLHIALKNHPEMAQYINLDKKPHLIRSRESLLLYNYFIAKDIYNLEIDFESERAIIPTPALRYKFLQQSLKGLYFRTDQSLPFEIPNNLNILEIGTGASAIIALLAAKHYNSDVIATEVDTEYIHYAKQNVERNYLHSKIRIINSYGKMINGVIEEKLKNKFDLIISNPPYYGELLEKESVWGGDDHELLGQGEFGEKFIIKMIVEGYSYLNYGGIISFIIPKKLQMILIKIEQFLINNEYNYDIVALEAGNRIRYVFRIYKNRRQN